jgi:hypothetical protein
MNPDCLRAHSICETELDEEIYLACGTHVDEPSYDEIADETDEEGGNQTSIRKKNLKSI